MRHRGKSLTRMICESVDASKDSRCRSLVPIYGQRPTLIEWFSAHLVGNITIMKPLTSHPCRGSYDDIDVGLVRMLVSSGSLDRPIDRCCDSVAGVLKRRRTVCLGQDIEVRFWCC